MDKTKMKFGPCVVSYKGSTLGATKGGVEVTAEVATHEVKPDQNYGQAVKKIATAVNITVSMSFMEIDTALAALLDSGKIDNTIIGTDLMSGVGELILTPVNTTDTASYKFPAAELLKDFSLGFKADDDQTVDMKFTAHADTTTGIFMEKITV